MQVNIPLCGATPKYQQQSSRIVTPVSAYKSTLRSQNASPTPSVTSLSNRIDVQKTFSKVNQEILNRLEEVQVLVADVKEKEDHVAYLENMTSKQTALNANQSATISLCSNNVDKLVAALEGFYDDYVERRKIDFGELRHQVSEFDKMLRTLKSDASKIDKLKENQLSSITQAEEILDHYENMRTRADKKIARLKIEKSKFVSSCEQAAAELSTLEAAFASDLADFKAAEARSNTLGARLNEFHLTANQHDTSLDHLSTALALCARDKHLLLEEQGALVREREMLEHARKAEMEEAEGLLRAGVQYNEEVNDSLQAETHKSTARQARFTALEQQYAALDTAKESSLQHIAEEQKLIEEKSRELTHTKKARDDYSSKHDQQILLNEAHYTQTCDTIKALKEAHESLPRLEYEGRAANDALRRVVEQHHEALTQAENDNRVTSESLQTMQATIHDLEAQIAIYKKDIADEASSNEEVKQEIAVLRSTSDGLMKEDSELAAQERGLQEQVRAMEASAKEIRRQAQEELATALTAVVVRERRLGELQRAIDQRSEMIASVLGEREKELTDMQKEAEFRSNELENSVEIEARKIDQQNETELLDYQSTIDQISQKIDNLTASLDQADLAEALELIPEEEFQQQIRGHKQGDSARGSVQDLSAEALHASLTKLRQELPVLNAEVAELQQRVGEAHANTAALPDKSPDRQPSNSTRHRRSTARPTARPSVATSTSPRSAALATEKHEQRQKRTAGTSPPPPQNSPKTSPPGQDIKSTRPPAASSQKDKPTDKTGSMAASVVPNKRTRSVLSHSPEQRVEGRTHSRHSQSQGHSQGHSQASTRSKKLSKFTGSTAPMTRSESPGDWFMDSSSNF